jgi:hypothetical protein
MFIEVLNYADQGKVKHEDERQDNQVGLHTFFRRTEVFCIVCILWFRKFYTSKIYKKGERKTILIYVLGMYLVGSQFYCGKCFHHRVNIITHTPVSLLLLPVQN